MPGAGAIAAIIECRSGVEIRGRNVSVVDGHRVIRIETGGRVVAGGEIDPEELAGLVDESVTEYLAEHPIDADPRTVFVDLELIGSTDPTSPGSTLTILLSDGTTQGLPRSWAVGARVVIPGQSGKTVYTVTASGPFTAIDLLGGQRVYALATKRWYTGSNLAGGGGFTTDVTEPATKVEFDDLATQAALTTLDDDLDELTGNVGMVRDVLDIAGRRPANVIRCTGDSPGPLFAGLTATIPEPTAGWFSFQRGVLYGVTSTDLGPEAGHPTALSYAEFYTRVASHSGGDDLLEGALERQPDGRWHAFMEHCRVGDTIEALDGKTSADIGVMQGHVAGWADEIVFNRGDGKGLVRLWREVEAGGTVRSDLIDGEVVRLELVQELVIDGGESLRWDSDNPFMWAKNWRGDLWVHVVQDGTGGDRIVDLHPEDWTPGTTEVEDRAGNAITLIDAEIVSTTGGTDPTAIHEGDGAGGILSGTFPNPGLNTEALQDAVAAMFPDGTYDDGAGEITFPFEPASAVLTELAATVPAAFGKTLLEAASADAARALLGVPTKVLHDADVSNVAQVDVPMTGYRLLEVDFIGRSHRTAAQTDVLGLKFETAAGVDSGSNYSTNAAALSFPISLGTIAASNTNTNRRGIVHARIGIDASAYTVTWSGAAYVGSASTTSPNGSTVGPTNGLWNGSVSAAPISIRLYALFGNITGRLIVRGIA